MRKNYTITCLLFFLFATLSSQAQDPSDVGQWSDPIPFGIVPVAVANLPDGRLIAWSSKYRDTYTETEDGMTYTEIFDPFAGSDGQALGHTTSNTDHDMFCPGINNLPDGRILAAGGTSSERTSIYDPTTGLWSVAADMNIRRGYQGNVTLEDGSVFTVGGSWSESTAINGNKDAELWTPETGWFLLPGIKGEDIYTNNDLATEARGLYRVDNHVWLWAAPDGRIFHAGPSEEMHWIDVANGGSIVSAGNRADDSFSIKGTTVMFDEGRILKIGGSESYDSDTPAKNNAYVIDINTSTPQVTQANDLNFSRTMHNSTVLPNGQVLVTGGLDHAEVFSDTGARLTGELFDPTTLTWQTVAGMQTPRTYHSVAILLVDGRVFVGGGGLCDTTPGCVNHLDAEIYSPPYLFEPGGGLATRPTIDAPDTADYNTNINVTGSANIDINGFSLIRFSAVTHSTNNEQRRIPVTATGTAGNYSVAIPDRNLLPPGYYMLFAMDTNGVPSIAETIQIGSAIPIEDNPNLVLHLEFEETSGSTAFDSSGNGNDATIYDVSDNAATVTPSTDNWTPNGLFGGAVEMDGFEFESNTIIDVPYDSSFDPISNSITVMAWVNRDDLQHNVGILSHDYPAMFFGFHNSLYKWEFPTDASDSANCYAGYSPAGQWVHIAATYDGETARLFANGTEICTQQVSGNIVLDPTTPNFSSFTSSGFYEYRDPSTVPGNDSGVTDEIDGRIDELKVYNKALGAEEIQMFYELGVGLPTVPNCPPGTIVAEYRIGTSGPWQTGTTINATEGSQVFLRAQTTGEYLVTTPEIDGNTFSSTSDFTQTDGYNIDTGTRAGDNDGLVTSADQGQYVLTTADGCATVVQLNVAGSCDPGDTQVQAEWSIDGGSSYQTGPVGESVDVIAQQGDEVRLSLFPNNLSGGERLRFDITLPNNSKVTGIASDYIMDNVTPDNTGSYLLESSEGCSVIINLTVEPVVCDETTIRAEWSLDDGTSYNEAPDEMPVVVEAVTGDNVRLSMVPNLIDFTITYEGSIVYDGRGDYLLGVVDPSNSGNYILTSAPGCSTTITLNVVDPTCDETTIRAEWSLDGGTTYSEAPDEQSVVVDANTGDDVRLSMLPNGIDFTVSHDGIMVYDGRTDYVLGVVAPSDSGDYIIFSDQGCTTTVTLNVTDATCDAGDIRAEWSLDGGSTYSEAPDQESVMVSATTGDDVRLSMVPNNIEFTITYNDIEVYSGQTDFLLGEVDPADSGDYVITSVQGCSTTISLNVTDSACTADDIRAEWSTDGGSSYEMAPDENPVVVTVANGSDMLISMLPNGVDFTVSYAGTQVYSGATDFALGVVGIEDSGDYIIRSEQGCVTTLTLDVLCPSGPFTPEYTIDGVAGSGSSSITVEEGTAVSLGTVEGNVAFTIQDPAGNVQNGDLDLGNVTQADAGTYTFVSEEGCSAELAIVVTDPCAAGTFTPQYTINGVADSGMDAITITAGSQVVLDIVQGGSFTITLPGGSTVNGTYDLGAIAISEAGQYVFTSAEGCTATLTITVTDPCETGTFTPEYTIDGIVDSGENAITVQEGALVSLGLVEDVSFTITAPDTTETNGTLDLGAVTTAQAGSYLFTSDSGCTATLMITVTNPCEGVAFTPQYSIDGVVESGNSSVTVQAGSLLILDILEGGTYTITDPNGTVTDGALDLGTVVLGLEGDYIFTSDSGCTATLTVTVEEEGTEPDPDASVEDIILYPNPVTDGTITFVLEDFMNETIYISFYDIYGKLSFRQIVPQQHAEEVSADISILSTGTYIVEIARSRVDENTIKKVIKLR